MNIQKIKLQAVFDGLTKEIKRYRELIAEHVEYDFNPEDLEEDLKVIDSSTACIKELFEALKVTKNELDDLEYKQSLIDGIAPENDYKFTPGMRNFAEEAINEARQKMQESLDQKKKEKTYQGIIFDPMLGPEGRFNEEDIEALHGFKGVEK